MADRRERTKGKEATSAGDAVLAPLLGGHTAEALGDWLGLSAAEVEALHKDAVF